MKPKDSDWLQGYGYQMWRCRHNAVRADGANGQYIIILPEQDAVIAMTANIGRYAGRDQLDMEIYLACLEIGTVGPTSGKPIRAPGRKPMTCWA